MSDASPGTALSMRILALEYSMQPPLGELDPRTSPLTSLAVPRAPVIHLFGPGLSGQKICVHVHGVLPYFFVPVPRDVKPAQNAVVSMAAKLGASLERAMCIALRGHGPFIHDVCAVRGKAFYGYHPEETVFFKIYVYSPNHVARAVLLLRTGAVLSREFQPHEAHIPYLLQFFADYNLAGMTVLRLSNAQFRYPVPLQRSFVWNDKELLAVGAPDPHGWTESTIGQRANSSWSTAPNRLSTCELEIDTLSDWIVNASESPSSLSNLPASSVKLVRSLAQICDDPIVAAAGPPPAVDLTRPPPTTVDRFQLIDQADQLQEILRKDADDAEVEDVRSLLTQPEKDYVMSTPAATSLRPTSGHGGAAAGGAIDVNEDLASQSSDADVRDILQWMARETEIGDNEEEEEEKYEEKEQQRQQRAEADDIVEASQAFFADSTKADELPESSLAVAEEDFNIGDIYTQPPPPQQPKPSAPGKRPGNIPVFAQLDGSGDEAPRHHKKTKLRLTTAAAVPPMPAPVPPPPAAAALGLQAVSVQKVKAEPARDKEVKGFRAPPPPPSPRKHTSGVHLYSRATFNALPLVPASPFSSAPLCTPPTSAPTAALPLACDTARAGTFAALPSACSTETVPSVESTFPYFVSKPAPVSPRTRSNSPPPPPPAFSPSSDDKINLDCMDTSLSLISSPSHPPYPILPAKPSALPPSRRVTFSNHAIDFMVPMTPTFVIPLTNPLPAKMSSQSPPKKESGPLYVLPTILQSVSPTSAPSPTKCQPIDSPIKVESPAKPSPLSVLTPESPLTHELVKFPMAPHRTKVAIGPERVAHYPDPAAKTPIPLPFFPAYLPNLAPYAPPMPFLPLSPKSSLLETPRRATTLVTLTPARLPPSRSDTERWLANQEQQSKNSSKSVKRELFPSQLDAPTNAGLPQNHTVTGRAETRQSLTIMYVEVLATARANLRPDPALDPVHAIVLLVHDEEAKDLLGSEYQPARTVLLLSDQPSSPRFALPIVARNYATEELLLDAFAATVRLSDPDIIVGWEVQGSSVGYLLSRQARLRPRHTPLSAMLGRLQERAGTSSIASEVGTVGEQSYQGAKATGIHFTGRVVLNLWRVMRSEVKLGSFTLSAFAFSVLGVRVPVHAPAVLHKWCLTSASLKSVALTHVFRLLQAQHAMLEKLDVVPRTAELARVFGIDFFSVLSRGSQYRVESMVLRLSKPLNYLLASPTKQQVAGQRFGMIIIDVSPDFNSLVSLASECIPLVMEPQSRFYTNPVLVLDFQSLYPSIIIAYNYCFSTCLGKLSPDRTKRLGALSLELPAGAMAALTAAGITISPNEVMFATKEHREGVLPRMLREILDTRVQVKAAMKRHTNDPAILRMLNSRQLGLKMIANVTYGYTGASFSGRMPCVDIADAIVQTARQTLENAIALVHSTVRWRARVVYGDTDSLFIELPGATKEQAFQVGNEIANAVSSANPSPVKLAFEKVYHPCVLISKKRYVGYKYESPTQMTATFEAKGIETVRRDTCPAVAKVLEKSLRILFEKSELAPVKTYLDRQCAKLREDRVSLRDLVFAKEVRLGTYSDRVPPPPAAIVAMKRMAVDPGSEPRYGERVPYVVVAGAPSARLIDLVVTPEAFIASAGRLRLNSTCDLLSLERILGLAGADVEGWFAQMPRARSVSIHKHTFFADASRAQQSLASRGGVPSFLPNASRPRRTLDQYYLTVHCPMCDTLMQSSSGLCDACKRDPQRSGLLLFLRLRRVEKEFVQLAEICMSCTGLRTQDTSCSSLDCPVFFERAKIEDSLKELEQVRAILKW